MGIVEVVDMGAGGIDIGIESSRFVFGLIGGLIEDGR